MTYTIKKTFRNRHLWIKKEFELFCNKNKDSNTRTFVLLDVPYGQIFEWRKLTSDQKNGKCPFVVVEISYNALFRISSETPVTIKLLGSFKDDIRLSEVKKCAQLFNVGLQVFENETYKYEDVFKGIKKKFFIVEDEDVASVPLGSLQQLRMYIELSRHYTASDTQFEPELFLTECSASSVLINNTPSNESDLFKKTSFDFMFFGQSRGGTTSASKLWTPVLAIEYDGGGHNSDNDIEKNKFCQEAGLPLIRINKNTLPLAEGDLKTDKKTKEAKEERKVNFAVLLSCIINIKARYIPPEILTPVDLIRQDEKNEWLALTKQRGAIIQQLKQLRLVNESLSKDNELIKKQQEKLDKITFEINCCNYEIQRQLDKQTAEQSFPQAYRILKQAFGENFNAFITFTPKEKEEKDAWHVDITYMDTSGIEQAWTSPIYHCEIKFIHGADTHKINAVIAESLLTYYLEDLLISYFNFEIDEQGAWVGVDEVSSKCSELLQAIRYYVEFHVS